ncbi:MAG: DNA repair protein RadA [Pseudomonadota bacterium]
MSKRAQKRYTCQSCGAVLSKWSGQCMECHEWNSIVEEIIEVTPRSLASQKKSQSAKIDFHALNETFDNVERHISDIAELDRVLGGGFVPGSTILVGGDPGIGKSTLLLQCAAALSKKTSVAYVSGEEGVDQISLRARRLNISTAPVQLANATNVRSIIENIAHLKPTLLIIDSIQTIYVDTIESAPGTVSQVRASAFELIRMAKQNGTILVMVGHVTKDGAIAGPRVLEHMVDAVLYFEGERGHPFRILRAVKNRFGATDEIGVFDMTSQGLQQVTNPSELFLSDRKEKIPGSCVFAAIEGTRPVLTEIQALVTSSSLTIPRRSAIGWDSNRLSMILAVLEARAYYKFSTCDIYLSVAGGLRIVDPGADLAAAIALISALTNKPVPANLIAFGEIGLAGDIRLANHSDARLREAAKLGFKQALIPERSTRKFSKFALHKNSVSHVNELKALLASANHRTTQNKSKTGIA